MPSYEARVTIRVSNTVDLEAAIHTAKAIGELVDNQLEVVMGDLEIENRVTRYDDENPNGTAVWPVPF